MNIRQALKQKNIIVKELQELYQLIRCNNSIINGNEIKYDIVDLMEQADSKMLELVKLKNKIHIANAPMYDKITLLSELKNKVAQYRGINTNEGKQSRSYGNSEPDTYIVQVDAVSLRTLVKGVENQINELQDELDIFNVKTEI